MNDCFDRVVDRSNNFAAKVEESVLHYGTNDLIPLWIADMDFPTAKPITDAIIRRAQQGIYGYTYRPDAYFETIAAWQKRRNGWQADPAKMAFAPGVIPGMRLYLQLFTNPEDKCIIQQPVYHPFADILQNTGRTMLVNPLKEENGYYTMDLEDLEEKAKEGAKYLILCNPHNPVGRSWKKEELEQVADLCLRYGIEVLSDEIHGDLMLFGHRHTPFASLSEEVAKITTTFTAPSKTFNLAGLQSSTIHFADEAKKERYIKTLKEMDIARNNCFSLVATMAAYEEGEGWLEELKTYLEGNMNDLEQFFQQELPQVKFLKPECTYLAWLNFNGLGYSADEVKRRLVERAKVGLSDGREFGFGGEGYFRLNAATPRVILERACAQIKEAMTM